MGKHVFKKLEPVSVQGVCLACGKNKQTQKAKGVYRPLCRPCHEKRHGMTPAWKYKKPTSGTRGTRYKAHKKDHCEKCGFVAEHLCQLDVDHVDNDRTNDNPSNLMTLCANCHRLKTYRCRRPRE